MVLGDLEGYMQKIETWPPTYTTHKNTLRMDKCLKYKSWYDKSPRRAHRQQIFRYPTQQYFHRYIP